MDVGRPRLGRCKDGQVGLPSKLGVDAALHRRPGRSGGVGRWVESGWEAAGGWGSKCRQLLKPSQRPLAPYGLGGEASRRWHRQAGRDPAAPQKGQRSNLTQGPKVPHTCMQTSVAPRSQASAARRVISSSGSR